MRPTWARSASGSALVAELVSAYVGKQGAGKSHELVRAVILKALKPGRDNPTPRRVLTNIEGIKPHVIATYFGLPSVELVPIGAPELLDDRNWPTLDDGPGLLFRGGDLIIVDEAHNIWPDTYRASANAAHPRRFRFIAEARHFTDADGRTCNLILATQNVKGLASFVRQRIGSVFEFRNRGRLGLWAKKQYRITCYDYDDEKPLHRCTRLWSAVRKYQRHVFTMYDSTQGGGSVDFQSADERTSIWSRGFFIPLFAAIAAIILGAGWASSYFNPKCPAPGLILLDGPKATIITGGKREEVTRIMGPDGPLVVRGRCAWRVSGGSGIEQVELRGRGEAAG